MSSLIASLALLAAPFAAAAPHLDSFDRALAADATLGALDYDVVEPERGLVLHIQVIQAAEADRADVIGDELGSLFRTAEQRFDAQFGSLGPREDIHVVVTQGLDEWRAGRGADGPPSPGGADFLGALGDHGAILTYDLAWPGSPRSSREAGLYEAFGQALMASHAGVAPDQLPGALVLAAGRLVRLGEGGSSTLLGRGDGAAGLHDGLIETLIEGGWQDHFLQGASDLLAPKGLPGLWATASAATDEAKALEHWATQRYEASGDEAAYLFAAGLDDASLQGALAEWVSATLAGGAGEPATLGLAESAAWARLLGAEHAADRAFDPRGLSGSAPFEQAALDLGLTDAPRSAAGELSAEDRLAEGLWLASVGRLEEAHAILEPVAEEPIIARHLVGIEALQGLRAAYLEHLTDPAVPEKLRIDFEGRLLAADVTRVGRMSVFLGDNTRGVSSLPITQIDIGELVDRMEREKPAFGEPVARAWAQALVGGKWSRSLSADDKRDKTLVADLEGAAAQLERGRVLHLLGVVDDAARSNPETRLEAISDLLTTAGEMSEVIAARSHLEQVARTILTERFQGSDLTSLLAAKSVELDGDKLTLEYAFKQDAELADWPRLEGYSPEFVGALPELKTEGTKLELDDRMLLIQGTVAIQHVLAFAAPLELTYELSYERTKKRSEAKLEALDYVYASVCDNLTYDHVRTSYFGALDIVNSAGEINEQLIQEKPISIKLGKSYEIQLAVDEAGKVTSKLDGKQVFQADSGGLTSGRVVFLVHSDRVARLHSIKIEGRLAEDQAPLRAIWIAGQLDQLGF